MPSDSVNDAVAMAPARGVVRGLLDPAFGFFVWIGHFVLIYVVTAVSCGLWITSEASRGASILVIALVAATVIAAALVVLHAIRHYRGRRQTLAQTFMARITIGQDAIAAFAILWQLIPIFMSPVCR